MNDFLVSKNLNLQITQWPKQSIMNLKFLKRSLKEYYYNPTFCYKMSQIYRISIICDSLTNVG